MEVTLKIRGIYTTALTRFFLDKGVRIVSPSRTTAKRFADSNGITFGGSFDVEISDLEDGQGILIRGQPEHSTFVVRLIQEAFFDVICRKTTDGLLDITEVEFPYLAKSALDTLRNLVVPTVYNHHHLRITASEFVDLMEEKELLSQPSKREAVSRNLEKRLIWESYSIGEEIAIEHVKIDGRHIFLSEGEIIKIDPREKKLTLKRGKFKGRVKYDGLNTPKKKGDYAITEIKEGAWSYKHTYFRLNGDLIGSYFNINTPVEFYPDKIRYVDLEIDVVRWPDGSVEVIDEGELIRNFESGYLSEALKDTAKKTAERIKTAETGTDFCDKTYFPRK